MKIAASVCLSVCLSQVRATSWRQMWTNGRFECTQLIGCCCSSYKVADRQTPQSSLRTSRKSPVRTTLYGVILQTHVGALVLLILELHQAYFHSVDSWTQMYLFFACAAVAVDSNHIAASSSASWSRFSPPSNLLMGTSQQCGTWSATGHNHRKVIGRDPICASQHDMQETVHQRPRMTREIETWLSDSRVGNSSVVHHRLVVLLLFSTSPQQIYNKL